MSRVFRADFPAGRALSGSEPRCSSCSSNSSGNLVTPGRPTTFWQATTDVSVVGKLIKRLKWAGCE